MNSLILAALISLAPGYNNVGAAGEVVAIEAATSNATATVEIQAISSLTMYTNATAEVVTYEPAWKVTYTNYDGEASVTTNVVGKIDYSVFTTSNGVNQIIGTPSRFDLPTTNEVVTAQVAAETYVATNDIATITTSGHFGQTVTNAYIFGGGILVTGAEIGDKINIIIK